MWADVLHGALLDLIG
uniref:Uncharacterized protein n=1 Tax=Lepeophtheirus salmonis TaxID=72036 RepID=A0A0K2THU8_LEPSM